MYVSKKKKKLYNVQTLKNDAVNKAFCDKLK